MLALRKVRPEADGLSLDHVDMPASPSAGQVLLRVLNAGICGTDLHIYKWVPFAHRMKLPTIMGHEMCGVVEAVGPGVRRVAPGMRVAVESHIPCQTCTACNRGWSHVCPDTRYPGVDLDGGFASHAVLPEAVLWPVADEIPTRVAAMMEPFGIAVHASLEGSGVSGQTVLVSGCGPIGLMNIAAARALGAVKIIATDRHPSRLKMAALMGADVVVDVGRADLTRSVTDATRGKGADVMIEYSGHADSLAAAGDCLAAGGELRLVGVPDGSISLSFERWLFKGLTIRNIHGRRLFGTWEVSSALLSSGRVDIAPLVSDVLPLRDARSGFDACLSGRAVKVLFDLAA